MVVSGWWMAAKDWTKNDPARMQRQPQPMRLWGRGEKVHVFCGAGWKTGYVVESSRDRCSVHLAQEQRTVVCTDNRNIARYAK